MKRSTINSLVEQGRQFVLKHQFHLPPFASWSIETWRSECHCARHILDRKLGWDVTDFGSGEFDHFGLILFTLRNGMLADLSRGCGMVYAEKILIVAVGQVTPLHYHWVKTEDIVNCGGGVLAIKLHHADASEGLASADITFLSDGIEYTVPAGTIHRLNPGSSITLPAMLYHSFWAEEEPVLAGEVSTVNDDENDNRFLELTQRFSPIEEDEAIRVPLVSDYQSKLL